MVHNVIMPDYISLSKRNDLQGGCKSHMIVTTAVAFKNI